MLRSPNRPRAIMARMTLDGSGTPWRISEMEATHSAAVTPSDCLVLSSVNRCVRLWTYPSDWRLAAVEDLLALNRVENCVPTASLDTTLTI